MRTIVVNGNVIPGDGETVLKDRSVVIENGMIQEIVHHPFIPYDPAEEIIDAKGLRKNNFTFLMEPTCSSNQASPCSE